MGVQDEFDGYTGEGDFSDGSDVDSYSESGDTLGNTEKSGSSEIVSLIKEIEGMRSLIGKWGNEMGALRSQRSSEPQKPRDTSEIMQRFVEDPENFIASVSEQRMTRAQQEARQRKESARATISRLEPDFDSVRNDIIDTIVKDIGDPAIRGRLEDDLYSNVDAGTLVNVAKRVKLEKKVKEYEALFNNIKSKGVDIDSMRGFSRGPRSGDTADAPRDPYAGVDPYRLSDEALSKLASDMLSKKRR